jgi:hypothetical protein
LRASHFPQDGRARPTREQISQQGVYTPRTCGEVEMKSHPLGGLILLIVLLDAALCLGVAGAALVLQGLLLPGGWPHVTSGSITLGLSLIAGALTALLALQD